MNDPLPLLRALLVVASLLTLASCHLSEAALSGSLRSLGNETASAPSRSQSGKGQVLWSHSFADSNWKTAWNIRSEGAWGMQNARVIPDPSGKFSQILRVHYPIGSASPSVTRSGNRPLGGAQFYATLGLRPVDALRLSYYVRFSDNFNFVKGGKLPGLFGGKGNSGGKVPNGMDGFSTRFMWRRQGDGEVYAYLPTSDEYGTSLGRGIWRFQPGVWQHLEQEIILNQPGKANGQVRVWLDGKKVFTQTGLTFRTIDTLKIEGLFFSTFFGGSDASWATPEDVYADFANFSVSAVEGK